MEKFGTPVVKITGYTGGIATFLAKDDFSQQCFVTSEPIEAQRKGSDPQTFLIAEAGFNPYATVVITQGKLLREKPELARAMVAACREGWRAYLDDAAAANQHMHQLNTEMDSETFKAAAEAQRPLIETADTVTNGLGSMTAERWKTLGQQLADLKVIASAPPPEECFVNLK